MQLYLMRPGLGHNRQEKIEGLSPVGIGQVRQAAGGIRQLKLSFDLILSSPQRRAHQTAALVAEFVRYAYGDILVSDCLLPQADPRGILDLLIIEKPQSKILIVGHQPNLGRFAGLLLNGGQVTLENASLAAFSYQKDPPFAGLDFLLTAEQLARLGMARGAYP